MSAEIWSPAAELTHFMEVTQKLGNDLAGNIANGSTFHGDAWKERQLQELSDNARMNAETITETYNYLRELRIVPRVRHGGQLGMWLGINAAPDNHYSLMVQYDDTRRKLGLAHIVLVDVVQPSGAAGQNGANVIGRYPPRATMTLGSLLFSQSSPRGSSI